MKTKFICTETDPITGECTDDYEWEANEETKEALLDMDWANELTTELDSVPGSRALDFYIAGIDIGDD